MSDEMVSRGNQYIGKASSTINSGLNTVGSRVSSAKDSVLRSNPVRSISNTAGRLGSAIDNINETFDREEYKRPSHVPFYEFKSTAEAVVWLFFIVLSVGTVLLFLGYDNPNIYSNVSNLLSLNPSSFLNSLIQKTQNNRSNFEDQLKDWIFEYYKDINNYYYLSNFNTSNNDISKKKKQFLVGAITLLGITWFVFVLCIVNRTRSGALNFLKGYHKNQSMYWGLMLLGFAALAGFCIERCVVETKISTDKYTEKTGSIQSFLPPGSHGGIATFDYKGGTSEGVNIYNENGIYLGETGPPGGTGHVISGIGPNYGLCGASGYKPGTYYPDWKSLSQILSVPTKWGPEGFPLGSGAKFSVKGVSDYAVTGRGISGVCILVPGAGYTKGSSVTLLPDTQHQLMQILPRATVTNILNTSGVCYTLTGSCASGTLEFVNNPLDSILLNPNTVRGEDGKWEMLQVTGASIAGQTGAYGINITDKGRNYRVGDILSLDIPAASKSAGWRPATIYVTEVFNDRDYSIPIAWGCLAGLFSFMTAYSWGRARDKSWIWKMIYDSESQDSFEKEEAEYDATIKQWGEDGGAGLNYGFASRYAKHMARFKQILKEQQNTLKRNQKQISDALDEFNAVKNRGPGNPEFEEKYRNLNGLIKSYNNKDSILMGNNEKMKSMELLNVSHRPSDGQNFNNSWVYLKDSKDNSGPVFVENDAGNTITYRTPEGKQKTGNKDSISLVVNNGDLKESSKWIGGGPELKK